MAKQLENSQCVLSQHAPMCQVAGSTAKHWHCDNDQCREYHSTSAEARWCEFKAILARHPVRKPSVA